MLKAGEVFHKKESLMKAVEIHGMAVGRKAKLIDKLSCGNGVRFRCVSFDEKSLKKKDVVLTLYIFQKVVRNVII
jgi:hypothetical protein